MCSAFGASAWPRSIFINNISLLLIFVLVSQFSAFQPLAIAVMNVFYSICAYFAYFFALRFSVLVFTFYLFCLALTTLGASRMCVHRLLPFRVARFKAVN